MKIKRRTKIVTETERKFSVSLSRQPISFFCAACDRATEMLSINEAATRAKADWREIVGAIENGRFHSTETDAGEIYVCAVSLSGEQTFKQKRGEQ